jgi:drug/metabolite transporter (DMT)-like permease
MLGILLALLAALAWGVTALFSRKGLQYLTARRGAFVANSTGFLLSLLVGLLFQRQDLLSLSLLAIGWFALTGIVSTGLANYFYYRAIHYVGASRATPAASVSPLLSIPLAVILLGEVINLPIGAGAIGVVAGLYLVTGGEGQSGEARKLGYIFALLTALCWATSHLLVRYGVTTFAPALAAAPVSLLAGALLMFPPRQGVSQIIRANRKLWLFVASGASSAMGTIFFFSAMSVAPLPVVSPLVNLFPLITILGSHLFLRRMERVTPRLIAGALLVIAGATSITIGRTAG